MFKLDAINKQIICHLREGRKSYKKIADDIGIAENTVKMRVRKLQEEKILDIAAYIDPEALNGHLVVYVGIQLSGMKYLEKGEEISLLKRVVSVGVVTGRFDLIATVHLKGGFGLLEFLSDELGSISGIYAIETFIIYKSFNLKVPYVIEEDEFEDPDVHKKILALRKEQEQFNE